MEKVHRYLCLIWRWGWQCAGHSRRKRNHQARKRSPIMLSLWPRDGKFQVEAWKFPVQAKWQGKCHASCLSHPSASAGTGPGFLALTMISVVPSLGYTSALQFGCSGWPRASYISTPGEGPRPPRCLPCAAGVQSHPGNNSLHLPHPLPCSLTSGFSNSEVGIATTDSPIRDWVNPI